MSFWAEFKVIKWWIFGIHYQKNCPRKKQFFQQMKLKYDLELKANELVFQFFVVFHIYVLYISVKRNSASSKNNVVSVFRIWNTRKNDLPKCKHKNNILDHFQLELWNLIYHFPKTLRKNPEILNDNLDKEKSPAKPSNVYKAMLIYESLRQWTM